MTSVCSWLPVWVAQYIWLKDDSCSGLSYPHSICPGDDECAQLIICTARPPKHVLYESGSFRSWKCIEKCHLQIMHHCWWIDRPGWGGCGSRIALVDSDKSNCYRITMLKWIWSWFLVSEYIVLKSTNIYAGCSVRMGAMASQITKLTVVYLIVYSGADQRKHQSFASLAFVGNSPVIGEFPAQRASDAENVSIWWRHHAHLGWNQHRISLNTISVSYNTWYS